MYRYRWRVNGAIRWDRLPLNSFKLPHAYFYGNCRAKIPNISQRCGNSPAKYKDGGERSFHVGERSDIAATIASRLPAGLASCTLPADG
jgi:hypothetical protein